MSVLRTVANTERNVFYVNNQTVVSSASANTSDFYSVTGAPITLTPNGSGDDILSVGAVLVRDMGKTVRVAASTGGQRLLRKVQRVAVSGLVSNDGVIGAAGASPQYGIFYIELFNTGETGLIRSVKWGRVVAPF